MFQYAFAYTLSKKLNSDVVLDLSWFEEVKNDENTTSRTFELDVFNINYEIATKEDLAQVIPTKHRSKIQKKLWDTFKIEKYKPNGNTFFQTNSYNFNKNLLNDSDYYYYEGYFQNEKYFNDEKSNLLKGFNSNIPLDEKNLMALNKITGTNSVSLHIRRGDYVTLESASKFHGTCSLNYYQKAIEYIARRIPNPHFFLFSDDICWVIQNLKIDYPFTVIDFNQDKAWLDLNLMKNCKHNILANSSFSWWGAWLNENDSKIIVAPRKWNTKSFKKCDIIPHKWVKL